MKKLLLLMMVITVLCINGCGANSSKNEDQKAAADLSSETKSIKDVKLADLIPEPRDYFLNTEFEMVTTEDSYIVYIDYATEDEWNNYISKCEDEGIWVEETYRSDYSWYIYSEGKEHQLLLDRYGSEHECMTILVKIVKDEISK